VAKIQPPPPFAPGKKAELVEFTQEKPEMLCTYERQGNRAVQIYIQRLFTSKLIGRPIVPTSETYVHVREISAPMSGGKI
jgi:hypothetical protein